MEILKNVQLLDDSYLAEVSGGGFKENAKKTGKAAKDLVSTGVGIAFAGVGVIAFMVIGALLKNPVIRGASWTRGKASAGYDWLASKFNEKGKDAETGSGDLKSDPQEQNPPVVVDPT